jgi:D-alanyl-lipoteichoic acid acyltransferase DltB (MBOAT superfamily)
VGPHPWGGGSYMRDVLILNEIWAQHKKTYLGRHFAWLKYFTYHLVPVLAPNYKQHILSSAKHIKLCYSLPEVYVKSVYLNLFGWRGA